MISKTASIASDIAIDETELTEILLIHKTPYEQLDNPRQVWNGPPNSHAEGLGRLIILTPEVVRSAAASCIRTGQRCSLGWDMTKLEVANFNRQPTEHKIVPILNGIAFDDIYTINPQQSSQWDGLRHIGAWFPSHHAVETSTATKDAPGRLFYGGVTASDIMNPKSARIGLQHWAKEGICGRGVLLDYVEYAARHGINYSTFSDHSISLETLKEIAKEQQTEFKFGDILFVRIGVTREWDTQMTWEEKKTYAETSTPQHAGVEGTEEMLRWIWDTGFAAVASDAISFEVYPPKKTYPRGGGSEAREAVTGVFMHEVLLPGWGFPVGELFDLEDLARICINEKRWEFFVSSAPFNMPGGVSSPPNCIAIF